jgi:hypothetical protein
LSFQPEELSSALVGLGQLRVRPGDYWRLERFLPQNGDEPEYPQHDTLGVREDAFSAILPMVDELTRNTGHGFTRRTDIPEEASIADVVSEGATFARELGIDPLITVQIAFDDTTKRGVVEVVHPIIPEYSKPFNQSDRTRRIGEATQDYGATGRSGRGGFDLIEQGTLHKRLNYYGMDNGPIDVEDKQEPDGTKKRSLSFRFWEKSSSE